MTFTVFIMYRDILVYVRRFGDEEEAWSHVFELFTYVVKGMVVGVTEEQEIRLVPPSRDQSYLV